jgi:hypothetical protein
MFQRMEILIELLLSSLKGSEEWFKKHLDLKKQPS